MATGLAFAQGLEKRPFSSEPCGDLALGGRRRSYLQSFLLRKVFWSAIETAYSRPAGAGRNRRSSGKSARSKERRNVPFEAISRQEQSEAGNVAFAPAGRANTEMTLKMSDKE